MFTVAFLVGVAVVGFLAVEVGPLYAADRFRDLREPTDGERKRLASLRETAGLDIERVAIETDGGATGDEETADGAATNGDGAGIGRVDIAVRGPPGRRVLFLTESVLDGLDEDVAIGLLAAEAGRVETYYGEFRAVSIAAVLGVLAAIVTVAVPFQAGFASLVAVALVAFWVGRRVQYAADDRAADAVGAGRVADAFERVAAVRGVEPARGDWSTWFEVQPPLGDRIAALRERAGSDD
ncbi:peptidase [Halorubrum sp. Ib24]|uniref:peptidase n=1 Tax=unclassified Halorubrum TaxID=2642239 RepID=UPI000B99A213|nr:MULTISPECIES: peptidase [unclassified Halorubrum]OYR39806.1 peptidase [Halorubrum sp. Ib24]OYR49743.1 peptidase [Halorubrum sp. Ea8]